MRVRRRAQRGCPSLEVLPFVFPVLLYESRVEAQLLLVPECKCSLDTNYLLCLVPFGYGSVKPPASLIARFVNSAKPGEPQEMEEVKNDFAEASKASKNASAFEFALVKRLLERGATC